MEELHNDNVNSVELHKIKIMEEKSKPITVPVEIDEEKLERR